MDEIWHIELLGGLRVTGRDRVINRFSTRQTASLLAYLAYHSHRSHPRELLIEQLWPESVPRAGRLRLRVALTSLRRQLEPPGVLPGAVIVAAGDLVQLNPGAFTTDVAEFEAALRSAGPHGNVPRRIDGLALAIEQYRGPLLPGYSDDWIVAGRQRLEEAFHRVVGALVRHWERAGDLLEAARWVRRALTADPLREEAHHELIRLLVGAGQIDAAFAHFQELERLLAVHLGARPADETAALVRNLKRREGGACPRSAGPRRIVLRSRKLAEADGGRGDGAPAEQRTAGRSERPASRLPTLSPRYHGFLPLQLSRFFGREAEIAALAGCLGMDRLVTLTGPAGSGKTRLAIEVARAAREAFQGAVWFVGLADLTSAPLILDRVQEVLRLPRAHGVDSLAQVVTILSRQRSLLLLDNLEA